MSKFKYLRIILLILFICSCNKNNKTLEVELNKSLIDEYGKPIIVFFETDPWLMVIGSDNPSFVLYDNGRLIYQVIENRIINRYLVIFNQNEINEFISYLISDQKIFNLKNEIWSSDWTDQPFNILYLDILKSKKIIVYGNLNNPETRDKTPFSFVEVNDKIKNYRNENAIEWIPPKIEVMFWDYDYAPNKRPWIEGFPDLNSDTTINRNGLYSVFVDGNYYDILITYLKETGEKEAVEINSRKMAISYRIPFPNIDNIK